MTTELALCIAMMLVAAPASRSIAAHYFVFACANVAFLGVTEADSSLLAMLFAILAIADIILILAGGRIVLYVTAVTSSALCLESIANEDWLLSHVTYLSVATNTAIAVCLAKEYREWMRGKFGRL